MLRSMTGYGRSEKQNGTLSCKAEIRSVNNRFIDINARFPKNLSALELPLKKLIKTRCARGSFDLFISVEKSEGDGGDLEIKPNLGVARQYVEACRKIQTELGLPDHLQIDALLNQKDIFKAEPLALNEDQEQLVRQTVTEALDQLIQMREQEGASLEADLSGNLDSIETLSQRIREREPEFLEEYKKKLQERVQNLTEGVELDPLRLAQETALLADRADISEELVRLASHLQQFRELMGQGEPKGRKLEFITQEINRETNTIGSKAADYTISQAVIEIKSHLEKIREQLQNIE